MLAGEGGPPEGRSVTPHRGTAVGKRKGWTGLGPGAHVAYQVTGQGQKAKDLVVGKVIKNTPASQQVEVQPYKGVWRQVRVCHLPLFVGPEGEATTTPSNTILRSIVAYPALTLAVELLRGGELMHSYARTLSDRGWGLLVDLEEQVNCLQTCAQSADGCLAVSAERPEAVRTLWGGPC